MLSSKQYQTKLGKLEADVKRAETERSIKRDELDAVEKAYYEAVDRLDEFLDNN